MDSKHEKEKKTMTVDELRSVVEKWTRLGNLLPDGLLPATFEEFMAEQSKGPTDPDRVAAEWDAIMAELPTEVAEKLTLCSEAMEQFWRVNDAIAAWEKSLDECGEAE
jgi:hypothetical protein